MSDPQRLIDDAEGLERELLEAWSSARAPAHAHVRAMALAGTAATGVLAASTSAKAATAVKAASAGMTATTTATTASATGAASGIAAKWIVVGALLAAAGAGSTVAVHHELKVREAATLASASSEARSIPPLVSATPVATSDDPKPAPATISVSDLPTAAPPPARSSASGAPALAPQLAELDRIREDLAANSTEHALGRLDAFDAKHPASPLSEEAAVLRFEAYERAGDHAAAARVARKILGRWPGSPYAPRLRRAIEKQ